MTRLTVGPPTPVGRFEIRCVEQTSVTGGRFGRLLAWSASKEPLAVVITHPNGVRVVVGVDGRPVPDETREAIERLPR